MHSDDVCCYHKWTCEGLGHLPVKMGRGNLLVKHWIISRLLLPAFRTFLQVIYGKYILLAIIGMCKCYIFTIIIPSPTFTVFTVVSSSDVSCKFHSCDRLRAITHVVSQKRSRCWRLIFVLALILGPPQKKSLTDVIQFRCCCHEIPNVTSSNLYHVLFRL